MKRLTLLGLLCILLLGSSPAHAEYVHRFSFGLGVVTMSNPSQTSFEIEGEYEYRRDPILGVGISSNYVFSNPSILLLAVPDLFLHPTGGDWFVSAAPLFEFGPGDTSIGARLGTQVPIPMGSFTLIPSFAIDFIDGGHDLLFGLGFQI